MDACLSDSELAELLGGDLPPARAAALHLHLDRCAGCQALFAALVETASAAPLPSREPDDALAATLAASAAAPGAQAPPGTWQPPRLFEEYEILRPLGRGGMGQVYLAQDRRLDRPVAIKFILGLEPDAAARERFLLEARAIARLHHPAVVSIYRAGEVEGRPFLVSELVEGRSLAEVDKPLPWREVQRMGQQLAHGLAAVHEKGVLHRDIKPGNVMRTPGGDVKLLDFGLAKLLGAAAQGEAPAGPAGGELALTRTGALLGTPRYMAPELWRARPATPATDVYSLGAMLYELCSGRPPHGSDTLVDLEHSVLAHDPRPLRELAPAGRRFAAIVDRCLRRDPAARFPSGAELAAALDRCAERSAALRIALPGALLLGALAALGVRSALRPPAAGAPLLAPGKGRPVVAVLGFQDLGGAAGTAWISGALSRWLATELSVGDTLRVVPWEDVAQARRDLGLQDRGRLERSALGRLRRRLGADLVVLGAYRASGAAVELQLRLQATEGEGEDSQPVPPADFFGVAARAGGQLRQRLGLSPLPAAEATRLRASLPRDPEAARLYTEGILHLQAYDYARAQRSLEAAAQRSPDSPVVHAALAEAFRLNGEAAREREAALRARELSGAMRREDRMQIEAQAHRAEGEFGKAAEVHRLLYELFPDNLGYGLDLAADLINQARFAEAETVVSALRMLPPPAGQDPRLDLWEEMTRQQQNDLPGALAAARRAAARAEERGARLLQATARKQEAWVLKSQGERQAARAIFTEVKPVLASFSSWQDVAWVLCGLGDLSVMEGALSTASRTFDEGIELLRRIGSRESLMYLLRYSAEPLALLGRLSAAKARLVEARELARSLSTKGGEASVLLQLGDVHLLGGELAEAALAYEQALGTGGPDEHLRVRVALGEGRRFLLAGDIAGARREARAALAGFEKLGLKLWRTRARRLLAEVALSAGDATEAERGARQALAEAKELGALDEEALCAAALAEALLAQGRGADAEQVLRSVNAARQNVPARLTVAIVAARARAAGGARAAARQALAAAIEEARQAGYLPQLREGQAALKGLTGSGPDSTGDR